MGRDDGCAIGDARGPRGGAGSGRCQDSGGGVDVTLHPVSVGHVVTSGQVVVVGGRGGVVDIWEDDVGCLGQRLVVLLQLLVECRG